MARKILTGYHLADGHVVYFTPDGDWSSDICSALVGESEAIIEFLDGRIEQAEISNQVTGAYLIEVERANGTLRPIHIRERIRTEGPTVRTDLGPQAGTSGMAASGA